MYIIETQDKCSCDVGPYHNFVSAAFLYTEHCTACSNQTQTARVYQNADSSLRKHEDLTQCCFNIGPAPLVGGGGQYGNSIGSNLRVCWAPHKCLSTPTSSLHNIFASRSGYFLARQPVNHKLTTILEIESGGHITSPICKF